MNKFNIKMDKLKLQEMYSTVFDDKKYTSLNFDQFQKLALSEKANKFFS